MSALAKRSEGFKLVCFFGSKYTQNRQSPVTNHVPQRKQASCVLVEGNQQGRTFMAPAVCLVLHAGLVWMCLHTTLRQLQAFKGECVTHAPITDSR
eukprot:1156535-Pelagomonas_calceolata.AAC.6